MERETMREDEEAQAEVDIWKYVFGFVDMAVVKCAIQLGIPDALEDHGGPTTLSDLSSALGCTSSALHCIMRFLVHRKIFKQDPLGYLQTPLSRLLTKNSDKSMADILLFESSPTMLSPRHDLSAPARPNGGLAFELAHGEDIWKFAAKNPSHRKLLDDAMACNARATVPVIIQECPRMFDGVESVVDVGGGPGTVLRMLVKAFPWLRGINFDLPEVAAVAPDCAGVEHVGGDKFASVPKADAAYIMCVLHDWDDDECIQVLSNCRKAIPKDKGKVIIIEAVVEEDSKNKLEYVRLMMDMVMMAHTNKGKERTSKEWAYLLNQSGFGRHTIKTISAVHSVIEAYP